MGRLIKGALAMAGVLAMTGGAAHASTSFQSASVSLSNYAYASSGTSSQTSYGSDYGSLYSTYSSVSAEAYASATARKNGSTYATASSDESGYLSLGGPSSGTLQLSGSSTANGYAYGGSSYAYNTGLSDTYSFYVSSPTSMSLSFSDSHYNSNGAFPYYNGAYFSLVNEYTGQTYLSDSFGNQSGSITTGLLAGYYTLTLRMNSYTSDPDYVTESYYGSQSANHSDYLSFNIYGSPYGYLRTPAAPEPSAWVLMIVGIGVAGCALRARAGALRPAIGA